MPTFLSTSLLDLPILAALYTSAFREPPWYEVFDKEEVCAEFGEMLTWPDAVFLTVKLDDQIVGGGIAFSVARKPEVRDLLPRAYAEAIYVSELFVAPELRVRGVCHALIEALLREGQARGATHACVRTSVAQPIIRHLFVDRRGFAIHAEQAVISRKLLDGIEQEVPDTRIIMGGILSP